MTFENPITFIRSIKGAPASVLMAMFFNRRPMTNQELQRWTSYGHDKVTLAIRTLLDLGWVSAAHACGPWSLVPGRQFPLGALPQLHDGPAESCDLIAGLHSDSLESCDLIASPVSSSLIHIKNKDLILKEQEEQRTQDSCDLIAPPAYFSSSSHILGFQDPKMNDQEQEIRSDCDLNAAPHLSQTGGGAASLEGDDREEPRVVANLQALYSAGIREPTAGRLARLSHVNPDYIAAHVDAANAQGLKLGTAIYRIQNAWPLPAAKRARTVEDKINKFMSGQWRSHSPASQGSETFEQLDDPPFDPEAYHD